MRALELANYFVDAGCHKQHNATQNLQYISNYAQVLTYPKQPLYWLNSASEFPSIQQAWGQDSVAPGLLCAGGDLSVTRLKSAYQRGIFPWFSPTQPILWWSPNPRMVLKSADFRLYPSLRKTIRKFARCENCQIRVDFAFRDVIVGCATRVRHGQGSTWIVPEMIDAYIGLHRAGFAHSVETWINDELKGGLYFVAVGQAVFGESMFYQATDCSKIALAALVSMCRHFSIDQIDCQQNTTHLASLGAKEMDRSDFLLLVQERVLAPGPDWDFSPAYWNKLTVVNTE